MSSTLDISESDGNYFVNSLPFLDEFGQLVYSFVTNSFDCLRNEVSRRIRQIKRTYNCDELSGNQIYISLTGFNEEKSIIHTLKEALEEKVDD